MNKNIFFLFFIFFSAKTIFAQNSIAWNVLVFDANKAVPVNGYCISSKNPDIHFAVSKTTVYKSTDGGKSFSTIAEKVGGYQFWMNKLPILIHPENPDIVYIGSLTGVMKSTDGGKTWAGKKVANGISVLQFHPENPNEIWAVSAQAGKTGGVWQSKDAGETWEQRLSNCPSIAFAICAANPKIMYAGSNTGRLEKSVDGGLTWESKKQTGELSGLPACSGVTFHPENCENMFLAASPGAFSSSDGGNIWIHTGHYLDRDVKYNPKNSSQLVGISNPYLGAAGGKGSKVYLSNDGGKSIINLHADEMISDINDKHYDGKNAIFNDIYFSPDGNRIYICTTSGVISTDLNSVK